jgi:hypothetical protein
MLTLLVSLLVIVWFVPVKFCPPADAGVLDARTVLQQLSLPVGGHSECV